MVYRCTSSIFFHCKERTICNLSAPADRFGSFRPQAHDRELIAESLRIRYSGFELFILFASCYLFFGSSTSISHLITELVGNFI